MGKSLTFHLDARIMISYLSDCFYSEVILGFYPHMTLSYVENFD